MTIGITAYSTPAFRLNDFGSMTRSICPTVHALIFCKIHAWSRMEIQSESAQAILATHPLPVDPPHHPSIEL